MRPIVSSLLIANIFVSLWAVKSKATPVLLPEGDTVVVKLKNKNKIMIITEKSKDLKSFKTIDINQIVADIDSSLNGDSAGFRTNEIEVNVSRKDSVLVIKKRRISGSGSRSYKAIVEIDEAKGDTIYREVHRYNKPHFPFYKHDERKDDIFELELGWNNYLESGSLPSDKNKPYGLSPLNSNIVTLRFVKTILGRRPKNRFYGTLGTEISWNNYKYENDFIIRKGSDGVDFDPFPTDKKMIKSKLTISWLNVPLMVHYRSKNSSFHIAAGGFAGYRLGSHNKIKYEKDGADHKDKEFTNFYLNSLQYGLRLQVGFYDMDLFASYNLNTLFAKDKGPALTPISFGITL
jgi:hypothetical protein